jgi:hypothetical protein
MFVSVNVFPEHAHVGAHIVRPLQMQRILFLAHDYLVNFFSR